MMPQSGENAVLVSSKQLALAPRPELEIKKASDRTLVMQRTEMLPHQTT
jgi:hypothetical protein